MIVNRGQINGRIEGRNGSHEIDVGLTGLLALRHFFWRENFGRIKAKVNFGMQSVAFDSLQVVEPFVEGGLEKGPETAQ